MSPPPGAVFLSYASQDAAPVSRLAEALRAAGVEVWFDQNELVGGDAWDAKIRKQIKECALFVPVISAATQARREGYFRIEWKLAAQRTHAIADGTPFLLPIVIDATRDADALVPEEFRAVQWTRLAGGETSAVFCEHVKQVLGGSALESARPVAMAGLSREAVPVRRGPSGWTWGAATVIVVGIVTALSVGRKQPASVEKSQSPTAPSVTETAVPTAKAKSIAVLPFENFSPDPDNAFFADGMHEEVITALTKIHDLTVISRMSVMAYRKTEGRNLKKIAAELGVTNVLEGSVQRAGNKVKVTVELIDARSDAHLWADSFTEEVADAFAIQAKIAGAITAALKAAFSPEEKSLLARRPTQNQEAYEFYLRARTLDYTSGYNQSRETLENIIALCDQAVAKDPDFVQAYLQLVRMHGLMFWYGYLDPTPARKEKARVARDAAVRLAPTAPESHLAAGAYIYYCENDWARALDEYRAAEAGLPNDAQLINLIGNAQRRLGQLPAAEAAYERSIGLNPQDQQPRGSQLWTLSLLHRYKETVVACSDYSLRFPSDPDQFAFLAAARLELSRDRSAYLQMMQTIPASPDDQRGLTKPYRLAMLRGDLVAADRALADTRIDFMVGTAAVINEPVALHHALVAYLLGDQGRARRLANEALAWFRSQTWTRRGEAWAMVSQALAHALAGQTDEAVRLTKEGSKLQQERDACDAMYQKSDVARVYLVLDRRDEAFAVLRDMMTGPSLFGPEQVRLDPLWTRVKDDPRFEEILRSAKTL